MSSDKWSSRVGDTCAAEHHLCGQKILVVTKSSVGGYILHGGKPQVHR